MYKVSYEKDQQTTSLFEDSVLRKKEEEKIRRGKEERREDQPWDETSRNAYERPGKESEDRREDGNAWSDRHGQVN